MNTHTRSMAIFGIAAVVGIILSTVAQPSLQALYQNDGEVILGPDSASVRLHRSYTTRDRARYNKAVQIYEEYLRQGQTGLIPPAINDPETVELYLAHPAAPDRTQESGEPLSTVDYAAHETDTVSTEALSDEERAVLSRSVKVGRCWYFEKFSPGFAELCNRLIHGKEEKRTTGVQSDLVELKRSVRMRSSSSK